jgi:hypothetical protein
LPKDRQAFVVPVHPPFAATSQSATRQFGNPFSVTFSFEQNLSNRNILGHCATMSVSMEEDNNESMGEGKMNFSSASTTIDPSVIQSRIRQSASLQNQDATMMEDDSQQPVFPKISASQAAGNKVEYRRVRCPNHRYTPLREHWEQILTPLVEYLNLQVRKLLVH